MTEKFECALASDNHFIRSKPLLIPCGHAICRECVSNIRRPKLKCQICSQMFDQGLLDANKTPIVEREIKANLKDLYSATEIRFDTSFKKLNDSFSTISESIEIQTNFIKDEIEIRIESLKNELDSLYEKLRNDVDQMKNDIIRKIKLNLESMHFEKQVVSFNETLAKLKTDVFIELNQNEETFIEYQNQLINMNEMIKMVNSLNWRMSFDAAGDICSEKLVGKIRRNSNSSMNTIELRNKLSKTSFETIISDVTPFDMCVLPNETIALCNYHNIKVYDEEFKLIKTIDLIDNKSFRSHGLTTDNVESIYISDLHSHQIIKCDLNFNKISTFGSFGNDINQFHTPKGVSFHRDFLYVCDFNNKRIQKLSSDLQLVESFKVKLNPFFIKTVGNTACISGYCESWDVPDLNFYDIESFDLLLEYFNLRGPVSVINSLFYHCDFERKKLSCYNADGIFIDEINLNRFDGTYGNDLTGILIEFNNELIISAKSNGKVLKF